MSFGDQQGIDPQLQKFIEIEGQKAKFQANVHQLTERCWEKCMPDKIPSRSDPSVDKCFQNCVGRFIDTSNFFIGKLQQLGQNH